MDQLQPPFVDYRSFVVIEEIDEDLQAGRIRISLRLLYPSNGSIMWVYQEVGEVSGFLSWVV